MSLEKPLVFENIPVPSIEDEKNKDANKNILYAIKQALGDCSGEKIGDLSRGYGVYLDRPEAVSFADGIARVKIFLQIRTGEYYDIPDSALLTCEIDVNNKSIRVVDAKDGSFVNNKLANPEKSYDEEGELAGYFSVEKNEEGLSEDGGDSEEDDDVVKAMKELIDWEALEQLVSKK